MIILFAYTTATTILWTMLAVFTIFTCITIWWADTCGCGGINHIKRGGSEENRRYLDLHLHLFSLCRLATKKNKQRAKKNDLFRSKFFLLASHRLSVKKTLLCYRPPILLLFNQLTFNLSVICWLLKDGPLIADCHHSRSSPLKYIQWFSMIGEIGLLYMHKKN